MGKELLRVSGKVFPNPSHVLGLLLGANKKSKVLGRARQQSSGYKMDSEMVDMDYSCNPNTREAEAGGSL